MDQADNIGRTPLFLAVDNGHLALAQLLISHGASRAITVLGQERTALGRATRGGHAELAAWLTATEEFTTPLHHLQIIDAARARAPRSRGHGRALGSKEGISGGGEQHRLIPSSNIGRKTRCEKQ